MRLQIIGATTKEQNPVTEIELAVIGGTGIYGMAALEDVEQVEIDTPFGRPSDNIVVGTLHGTRIAFLPRHGRGHFLTPTEVPYRANICALKLLGVKFIISVSACGSLREDYRPGDIVVPDQLVDFTKGKRENTFFGQGLVAHIGVPDPFSPELRKVLIDSLSKQECTVHSSGTYVTIEGPRFSTRGESNLFRQWGMSIIGMTTSPEAFLAAEAEIAYACMAHITDYDVWHDSEDPVNVEMVLRISTRYTAVAQNSISTMAMNLPNWRDNFAAHTQLHDALGLIGDWSQISEDVTQRLRPIIGKYLP